MAGEMSSAELICKHIDTGCILLQSIKPNDKLACQRTDRSATGPNWMQSACACEEVRARERPKPSAGAAASATPAKTPAPCVWSEYIRVGSTPTAIGRAGIERVVKTSVDVVYSGEIQIKKATKHLEKKRAGSVKQMCDAKRSALTLPQLKVRAIKLNLPIEHDAVALLQDVLAAETAMFATMELHPLWPEKSKLGALMHLSKHAYGRGIVFDALYSHGDPNASRNGSHAKLTLSVELKTAVQAGARVVQTYTSPPPSWAGSTVMRQGEHVTGTVHRAANVGETQLIVQVDDARYGSVSKELLFTASCDYVTINAADGEQPPSSEEEQEAAEEGAQE